MGNEVVVVVDRKMDGGGDGERNKEATNLSMTQTF